MTKENEEQHNIGRMEQDIHIVITRRVQLEKLIVQSVREPGDRVPVGRVTAGECPGYGFPRQSAANVRIVGDVNVVVKIGESIVRCTVVDGQRGQKQQQA